MFLYFSLITALISLKTKKSNGFHTSRADFVAIAHKNTVTVLDKNKLINRKELVNTANTIKKNKKIVIAKHDKR